MLVCLRLVSVARLVFFLSMTDATRILNSISGGDSKAADELFPLVYRELRQLAAGKMASEPAGHTLQPTALVHEAWMRLVGSKNPQFQGRGHFFAAAAEAMRRILIERARRKHAAKRGAGFERLDLEHADIAIHANDETLLLVNDALDKLAGEDSQAAELVNLRFFAGMTNEEAAAALGISVRTAKRHWTFARAWLCDEIRRSNQTG
jgi:RNA polymerase sigma factor (TIGR02999 family)